MSLFLSTRDSATTKYVSHRRFLGYIYFCNQSQFINKEIIMKRLVIKIFARNFLQLPIEKNIIATLRIVRVDIPTYIIIP